MSPSPICGPGLSSMLWSSVPAPSRWLRYAENHRRTPYPAKNLTVPWLAATQTPHRCDADNYLWPHNSCMVAFPLAQPSQAKLQQTHRYGLQYPWSNLDQTPHETPPQATASNANARPWCPTPATPTRQLPSPTTQSPSVWRPHHPSTRSARQASTLITRW